MGYYKVKASTELEAIRLIFKDDLQSALYECFTLSEVADETYVDELLKTGTWQSVLDIEKSNGAFVQETQTTFFDMFVYE